MLKKLYHFLFEVDLNEAVVENTVSDQLSWKSRLVKDVTLLVLFSYVALIFHAVVPVVADSLAHTFWEKEHLASEHHQYGKNHVALEISKLDKQDSKDKGPSTSKTNTEDFSHILFSQLSLGLTAYKLIKPVYQTYYVSCTSTISDVDYKPPRV